MSTRSNRKDAIARALAAHAMRMSAPDKADWTRAMIHEQEYLPPGVSVLSWALGCAFVSYRGRLGALFKLPDLPRWLLLTVLLLCLGPACAYFVFVAVSTAQGYPLIAMTPYTVIQEGLIFGSAALIGPIGVAAVVWTLSSSVHRLGIVLMVALWLLTIWALAVHVGLLALLLLIHIQGPWFLLWLKLFVPFVLLPALAVVLLRRLETRGRRPLGLADA